jgi:hypothetical protein
MGLCCYCWSVKSWNDDAVDRDGWQKLVNNKAARYQVLQSAFCRWRFLSISLKVFRFFRRKHHR